MSMYKVIIVCKKFIQYPIPLDSPIKMKKRTIKYKAPQERKNKYALKEPNTKGFIWFTVHILSDGEKTRKTKRANTYIDINHFCHKIENHYLFGKVKKYVLSIDSARSGRLSGSFSHPKMIPLDGTIKLVVKESYVAYVGFFNNANHGSCSNVVHPPKIYAVMIESDYRRSLDSLIDPSCVEEKTGIKADKLFLISEEAEHSNDSKTNFNNRNIPSRMNDPRFQSPKRRKI